MKQQIKSSLILLLTATIWGVAFVAQSVGMEYIGPFTFNAIRCVLGGMVLIPVILVLKKKKETGIHPRAQAADPPQGVPVDSYYHTGSRRDRVSGADRQEADQGSCGDRGGKCHRACRFFGVTGYTGGICYGHYTD